MALKSGMSSKAAANDDRKSKTDTLSKEFNPKIEYEVIQARFKDEFIKRWETMKSSPETGLEGFIEIATLGSGSFGKVKLVKEKKSLHYFAAKIMIKDQIVKTKQTTHIFNEKRVLHSVRFPFLIKLEFSTKDNDNVYLGLPFVNGGELFTYHRKVRKFNEKQARFYAAQVFLGLEYLHNVDILYRDLKPENIMIDDRGYLKVTDFGFAKKVEGRTLTLCGTPEYLAPEIIQSRPYGTSVDWWAFGVLIYEFVAGSSPFAPHSRDVMFMYSKICDGEYKMPSTFSHSLKELVDNLLQVDLSKRYGNLVKGCNDIRDHDWFKGTDWFGILNQEVNAPYVPAISNIEDLSNFDKYPESKASAKSKVNKHADLFAEF
ncbi:cAMP-dependent protein kinase catalytic subunit 2 [Teleopsis dalmanni]|uniref:cAMP-dependent protein kinase catalytic subunit 2 n=1 Tax=Teleopsis dalmanni TaxID=139649 RepID=UPI0018CF70F6|nr:cAMP-dependent protein kinase catalytic subunit 2 [Teleopsis dalmanni]